MRINWKWLKQSKKLFCCVIGLAGCTEIIDLDLHSGEDHLVVDAMLTNEYDLQLVRLTRSAPYFINQPAPPVLDAEVMIQDEDQTILLTESREYPGYYYAEPDCFLPEPGHSYTLQISGVDIHGVGANESYSAVTSMPSVVKVDSVALVLRRDFEIWQMLVWFQDPPDSDNYYLFRVRQSNYYITNKINDWTVTSNDFFRGNYVNGLWVQTLNASNNQSRFEDGDVLVFEMAAITEEFYEYVTAMHFEEGGRNPMFGGPPANISGNISNGALGIFTAISVDTMSLVFDSAIHNQ